MGSTVQLLDSTQPSPITKTVPFSFKPCSRRLGGFFLCTRFSFFKPRSLRLHGFGFLLCLRFFFVGEQTQTPTANCLHRMMSSSANYRPFLSSFCHIPPSGGFCQVSKLTVYTKKWWPKGENVNLVQLGPKSFGDGRQDICKDKASNLGPAAG